MTSVLSTYAGFGTRWLGQRTRLERHHWDYTSAIVAGALRAQVAVKRVVDTVVEASTDATEAGSPEQTEPRGLRDNRFPYADSAPSVSGTDRASLRSRG